MNMNNLKVFKDFLLDKTLQIKILEDDIKDLKSKVSKLKAYTSHLNEAMTVMNAVSVINADDFNKIIEGIVTEMLQVVYGKSYSFIIENSIQRNQPETNFYVKIGDKKYSLKFEELGGGVIDVVSFALRITTWAISSNKTDNIIIADEPVKNVDSDRLVKVCEMIKKLSSELCLQFLIVTHETELSNIANSSWNVKMIEKDSIVERIQ